MVIFWTLLLLVQLTQSLTSTWLKNLIRQLNQTTTWSVLNFIWLPQLQSLPKTQYIYLIITKEIMKVLMTSWIAQIFHLLSVKQRRIYLVIHEVHPEQCYERIYSIYQTKHYLPPQMFRFINTTPEELCLIAQKEIIITNLLPILVIQTWYDTQQ